MTFKKMAALFFAMAIALSLISCTSNNEADLETHTIEQTNTDNTEVENTISDSLTESSSTKMEENMSQTSIIRKAEDTSEIFDLNIDPFAFYVGRVVQSVSNESSNMEAVDLSQYINRNKKTIVSQTGELLWDYEHGVIKYDSPYFQGALGFYKGVTVELSNIAINSESDYITIACVPLDGKPISESEKILIQAMTQSQFKYYATNDTEIVSSGKMPFTVEDIKAELRFKNVKAQQITRLDANGYIYKTESAEIDDNGNVLVKLNTDSIYTVLSTSNVLGKTADYVEKESWMGLWDFVAENDTFDESPIDLSNLNEDIAGEKGFVSKNGDDFVLGDGTPVKFWAVNVGIGVVNRPREEIDYIAKRIAKSGVNMVRLHGSLNEINENAGDKFNDVYSIPDKWLDNYHYFVYAMKKEGIYSKLSYYFPLWVRMKESFGFEGYTGDLKILTHLHFFNLTKDFKKYTRVGLKKYC